MRNNRKVKKLFLSLLPEDVDKSHINAQIRFFSDIDWQNLYNLACKSGLYAHLYDRLVKLKPENIPAEFISKLKNLYFLNLKKNSLLERELLKIVLNFGNLGIPIMPIKGPVLAKYLYNDVGLRQASYDLDLLVEPHSVEIAKEKLQEMGYSFTCRDHKKDFLCPASVAQSLDQLMFTKSMDGDPNVELDLHWSIRGFFLKNDLQKLWEEAHFLSVDGVKVLQPSNVDVIIYLGLISMSIEEPVRIKHIYDLHKMIVLTGKELDWESLRSKVQRARLGTCLYFSLKLAATLFSTNIPEGFLGEIKPNWAIRRLVGLWINGNSIMEPAQAGGLGYPLRFLLARFVYSANLADFTVKFINRMRSRKCVASCG